MNSVRRIYSADAVLLCTILVNEVKYCILAVLIWFYKLRRMHCIRLNCGLFYKVICSLKAVMSIPWNNEASARCNPRCSRAGHLL